MMVANGTVVVAKPGINSKEQGGRAVDCQAMSVDIESGR